MFECQDQQTSFKLLYQRLQPKKKQITPLIRQSEKSFGLNENRSSGEKNPAQRS